MLAVYAYPAEAQLFQQPRPPHITSPSFNAGLSAPVITSPSTAHGTTGTPFSYQITATKGPTRYGASGLPSWAGINTSTGAITGTPTATGTSNITLSATNAAGTGTSPLTITIVLASVSAPVVNSPTTSDATVGNAFFYRIAATNGPTSFNATGLPSGLNVNTTSGYITGTPTGTGTTNITVSATNGGGTGTGPLTLTVSATGGLLHVLTSNPLYLATPNGKAVYLTGNHTWTSGQSFSNLGPFSFTAFADYLATLNVNFIRHWDVWDATNADPYGDVSPLPVSRSGTCCAWDGGNKFDVTSFNQSYFDAVKADVEYAASKGMYIMVLLYFDRDYYPGSGYPAWTRNYWNGNNNFNGTTTDPNVIEAGTDATTLNLQKAYLHKFLDTLATEPNVLYEVANEPDRSASNPDSWQATIINEVHSYEAANGYLHHPISAEYDVGSAAIGSSPADFIEPQQPIGVNTYGKPVFYDTDHLFGLGGGTDWLWTAFMQGKNPLSMDDMEFTGLTGNLSYAGMWPPSGIADMVANRPAIQQTRAVASMVDLTAMTPQGGLASTGLCLADTAGSLYLVYASSGGSITVDLSSASGVPLKARWIDATNGTLSSTTNLTGGSSNQSFSSPFGGTPAALVVTP